MRACLWFNDQAEEAASFYIKTFRNGKLGNAVPYDENGAEVAGRPAGSVMVIDFEVEGQQFMALNGGPTFTFSEAISFVVERDTQEELDDLWEALTSDGGIEQPCGWCKDKFGVSWQITPSHLPALMSDPDPEIASAKTKALFGMKKIIIADLENAGREVTA
jgi:predicted 3-demethylubiquinone-9 3-methyltransferase (glyoxalase superfamily)